jgi:hypothetical protein
MNEINHFKFFLLCSGDVAADVDHLHVKRIQLVGFSYIVIEDVQQDSEALILLLRHEADFIFKHWRRNNTLEHSLSKFEPR